MLSSQKMNLDYVRTFVVLAQSNNMTTASKRLDVNVSYISRHLKALEDALGVKLVIPSPKNKDLQLTKAGEFFYRRYEKIYNDILLTEKEYKQTEQLDNCKITIGICPDLEENIVKPKILEYSKTYPNIAIKIVNGNTEDLVNKLNQYAVDIIIQKDVLESKLKEQVITTHKIQTSNYCYVYNKDYIKNIKNIEKIPFILPVAKTKERIIIDDYFKNNNLTPNIKYEIDDINQIISYVKDGLGVGVVLKDIIKDEDNLTTKDIDISSDICVSYIKGKTTPSTNELLKLFNVEL